MDSPRELPILFSGPLVRAILAGTKTQTRRVVTARTSEMGSGRFENIDLSRAWVDPGGTWLFGPGPYLKAPAPFEGEELIHRVYPRWTVRDESFGEPGTRLWVRETFAKVNSEEGPALTYRADHEVLPWRLWSKSFGEDYGAGPSFDYDAYPGEWCMWWSDLHSGEPDHRWSPSIHMPRWASRLTLEVTEVRVERVQDITEEDARAEGVEPVMSNRLGSVGQDMPGSLLLGFRDLWDSINAKRGHGWESNPWVWVVSFQRVEGDRA